MNRISNKAGIPALLAFLFIGMLFGSDGLFKINFDNLNFAKDFCSIALIIIMFYGGFGTNLNKAKPIIIKASLLSSLGVFLTAIFTALFCNICLKINFLESMLIGSVISSTDAASVFSILRSKHLNLKDNTASLLEVESGSNDPFANIMVIAVLSIMNGKSNISNILLNIFLQIFFGILIGFLLAWIAIKVFSKTEFKTSGFNSIFVLTISLVSFALSDIIGGNGYLSTYITGIILGNAKINDKKILVNFFDGVSGLSQMMIFFILGLLSFPSQLYKVALPGLLISIFLTFIARPITTSIILTPFKAKINQQGLIAWSGLRGASAIVFSIIATTGTQRILENDIFHITFFIVLFSIIIQGSLIPYISKKFNMIDNSQDVMKTFSDYTNEVPIQFLKIRINNPHPWYNKHIKDINLIPNVILTLIIRDNKQIIPRGNIKLQENDLLILSGKAIDDNIKPNLSEMLIDKDNDFINKKLNEIKIEEDKLIILIKRNDKIIIPRGQTVIKEKDVLIINTSN